MTETWLITGATSKISEGFAHEVAKKGANLILCGRNLEHLNTIAQDIKLRFQVKIDTLILDFSAPHLPCFTDIYNQYNTENPLKLFIAHSVQYTNDMLSDARIIELITINITRTIQILDDYFKTTYPQTVIFISSVAAMRGRAKNSLYGASKKAVEIYLEGKQQENDETRHITLMNLGFVDTKHTQQIQTFLPKAPPQLIAKKCIDALKHKKKNCTTPFIWRPIMFIIRSLPFSIYRYLKI